MITVHKYISYEYSRYVKIGRNEIFFFFWIILPVTFTEIFRRISCWVLDLKVISAAPPTETRRALLVSTSILRGSVPPRRSRKNSSFLIISESVFFNSLPRRGCVDLSGSSKELGQTAEMKWIVISYIYNVIRLVSLIVLAFTPEK